VTRPPAAKTFRCALLFSGHMVDLPDRTSPRFPPEMEAAASREIAAATDRILTRTNPAGVVAISSLARGGDILFQEHARARGVPAHVVLPFEPHLFVEKSVRGVRSGDWELRFWQIWDRTSPQHRHVLAPSADDNPYEACNRRQLELAAEMSADVVLIALSDGTLDGAGGTQDMVSRARAAGGRTEVIDAGELLARLADRR
jgi:hypothetical protein